ncbi:glycosyltransferase family 2 protein [Pseudomonas sp. RL]|uniref:glycosyltransferase family 2 protein n=1 Tax=Pseudomonas sp. RL TaxID=1452718 RepID=UPI0004876C6A|nr:glycosyltransferase family 2 protein [Pseudomonas sp. RL]
MNDYSVCVIIPLYNADDTIDQALDSLAAQTRRPDRVIVVDDGSTDAGPERVERYRAPFPLTLIRQTNQGPAAARNRGIFQASDHLLAFLDADDYWLPTKLEKQLECFKRLSAAGRRIGLVDCFGMNLFADGRQIPFAWCKAGWHFRDFQQRNVINCPSSVLMERELATRFGGFDARLRFAEDRWLWTQVAERAEIHTVQEVLYHRLVGPDNITAQPERHYPHKLRFVELYLEHYGAQMSPRERTDFILANQTEFLEAFSRLGQQHRVIQVFEQMLRISWRALLTAHGKPALRYAYARATRWRMPERAR